MPDPGIAELIEAHGPFLRALALRMAPAPGLAEDIAQQVFLEFITKSSQWDLSRDVRPLLVGMTRNVALRAWRERTRQMPEAMAELAEHIRHQAEAHDVAWFDEEEKVALRRCLERLPEKSRKLIDLRYAVGVTSADIARQINMNANTVRQVLSRLRERLRKCMQQLLQGKSA